VSCAFDLEHYRELLEAATAGGYQWVLFDHDPEPGDLFLRHDVDLTLDAAITMAELEAGLGRFDRVVAWHNPEPEYMTQPLDGVVNVMQPPFFDPDQYRSDSNQHWRHGCPHEELRAGSFPWLQLLVHPEIWVYPGATMGETMHAMLDAERERRLQLLAVDRIDLS
jgi:hypothetical protein